MSKLKFEEKKDLHRLQLLPPPGILTNTKLKIVTVLWRNPSDINLLIFFNVYLFLRQRETDHDWGRVRERGRHRI